jgi:hypothetical protein
MDVLEYNVHSFIVKIWLEESADEGGQAQWRGHITHVPSKECRYLLGVDDIVTFVAPYLETMGVKMGIGCRVKRWLKQQKSQVRARE